MFNFKGIPKVIWANTIFFIYVLFGVVGGVIYRNISSEWENMKDVRLEYDLFFGLGFSALSILAIVGLLLRKEWGRQFSIAFCAVLFFANFVLRIGVYIYFKYSQNLSIVVVDPDAIVVSILSFMFLVLLMKDKTKEFFRVEIM